MLKLCLLFLVYYVISGIIMTCWGWYKLHKPENSEKLKGHVEELASELGLTHQDCFGAVCLAFPLFGFLILPVALVRKIMKSFKEE